MKFFRTIFLLLYRIWFYLLVTLPILLLFPVLIVSISREKWYSFFFRLARIWAKFILIGMGLKPVVRRSTKLVKGNSYMLVANHTSMIDIMLMLYVSKNPFVFVGKKELAKYPLFGFFYKRTSILVDRDSVKSRQEVFRRAQEKLNQGLSVCIFPEGLVPDGNETLLAPFKDGAFRLAIEHHIPIVPMTFFDNKKRFPYEVLSSGGPGILRVKVHDFIPTTILELEDKRMLKNQVYELLLNDLRSGVF